MAKKQLAAHDEPQAEETQVESAAKERDHDVIIYRPGPQDPPFTRVNGITFQANVPVKIPRTKTVEQLLVVTRENEDGQILSRGVPRRITMAKQLEDNPCFEVNGKPPRKRKVADLRVPSTASAYRAYATRWIAESDDPAAMDARWEAEAQLRANCGVDDSDIAHLTPFFQARHSQVSGTARIDIPVMPQ